MIAHRKNAGFSMIEVLITIVILMIGLLGLAGLQTKALTAQMEAYQRSQALILLKDMVDRVSANRKNAAFYVATLGTDVTACPTTGNTVADGDLCEWHNALLGAAEVQDMAKVGAMIGARGCITGAPAAASGVPSQYLVAVAWQGLNATVTPASTCGATNYGGTLTNEPLRRVVALPVAIADLN